MLGTLRYMWILHVLVVSRLVRLVGNDATRTGVDPCSHRELVRLTQRYKADDVALGWKSCCHMSVAIGNCVVK